MDIRNKTVGQWVAEDYRTAEVFKKHGIDFCCGGGRSVQDVCEKKGVDYALLEKELLNAGTKKSAESNLNASEWQLDFLADYIVNVHHAYVRQNIPYLLEYAGKVAKVHGNANPETVRINELINQLVSELQMHMVKEEKVLFPYIKKLARVRQENLQMEKPHFGTVHNPVRMMEAEHEHAGGILKQIRSLSRDFTPPAHACNTYRVLYFKLQEFESDLHRHIHLENNILFPKSVAMELMVVGE
ncbi:MAG TPA: iron-sulfur cluster repair di-iron protein [Chitinophagales bacterium]|nr:iron-sulfur cluster repair di-iron protein [Chitinophagales bacterium]